METCQEAPGRVAVQGVKGRAGKKGGARSAPPLLLRISIVTLFPLFLLQPTRGLEDWGRRDGVDHRRRRR